MFYADDSVLLAPSAKSLQQLLDMCFEYANDFELTYNIKTTKCMCIKPKWLKNMYVPSVYLGGRTLEFVDRKVYLGCIICDDLCDNLDIKRSIRSIYIMILPDGVGRYQNEPLDLSSCSNDLVPLLGLPNQLIKQALQL